MSIFKSIKQEMKNQEEKAVELGKQLAQSHLTEIQAYIEEQLLNDKNTWLQGPIVGFTFGFLMGNLNMGICRKYTQTGNINPSEKIWIAFQIFSNELKSDAAANAAFAAYREAIQQELGFEFPTFGYTRKTLEELFENKDEE